MVNYLHHRFFHWHLAGHEYDLDMHSIFLQVLEDKDENNQPFDSGWV